MAAEDLFHRRRNFPEGRIVARGFHRQRQQVRARCAALGQRGERRTAGGLVAAFAHLGEAGDLACADLLVIDLERLERVFLFLAVLVDADDHRLALVDLGLLFRRRAFDRSLGRAGGDEGSHAARRVHFLDQLPRFIDKGGGQRLDIVRAAERIDDRRDPAFLLQHQLGVAGDAGGEIGGERDRFVERIGVERLGAAEHRRHGFYRGADDVVVGVLLLQADARGLAMGAQHLGAFVLRPQPVHDAIPQRARGAQLGDLHEEVHADAEEEAEAARESVDIQPCGHGAGGIFLAVGDGEGELLHGRRPGLVHVVAADRNAVEFRHVGRGVCNDVRDDPHRRLGRVDVGVADHELLENVVLDGPVELLLAHALTFRRDDEEGQHRDHRAVHRHRDRHGIERNLVEQDLHVRDRVDRHARLADIANDARVIGIVTAVGGKVEGDRQPLLPHRQIAAVEGVALLGGREARILPDGPRTAGIHRGLHTAREGREAGKTGIEARVIFRRVERLDREALGRVPGEVAALHFLGGEGVPVGEGRFVGHVFACIVTPAKAGVQLDRVTRGRESWIPACAGMTGPYSPLNSALRFWRKAMPPSIASLVAPAMRWPSASASSTIWRF